MARKRWPVKLTGGGGFAFEDAVAAHFALRMLTACKYLGAEFGPITTIDFQAREQGWLLDDLVVTFAGGAGPRYLAISVKSDRQVTRNGFPAGFVRAVWEQWLGADPTVFTQNRDVLALAVGKLAPGVKSAWDEICEEACEAPPERIVQRLGTHGQSARLKRALFASLRCPNDLSGRGPTDEVAAARLLARVRLIHFDFESDPSHDFSQALDACQSAMESGGPIHAPELWQRLIGIAAEQRPLGGQLTLPKLIDKLRPHYPLKLYPDHRHDWELLAAATDAAAERIRDQVGDGVRLDRSQLQQQVAEQLKQVPAVVLIGESGCGKSALAKQIMRDHAVAERVVWLSAGVLDAPDLAGVRRTLGLSYDLLPVLGSVTAKSALLVLDGIDWLSPRALACAADLLRSLTAPCTGGSSPWRVLLTAEPTGWDHVGPPLLQRGVDARLFGTASIDFSSGAEVGALLARIPALNHVAHRPELRSLLRNLKVLDWVAATVETRPEVGEQPWVGFSDVMDWVWEYWVESDADKYARGSVLKKLGVLEGDGLTDTIPLNRLDPIELQLLGTPAFSRLIRAQDERLRFTHDLVGDWARVRVMIGEQDTAPALVTRAALPRWHRAIRLYGQRLLEKHSDGTAEWRRVLNRCAGSGDAPSLARDLLLESVVFAVDSDGLLERAWPDLKADLGLLLARLLRSFLHSATFPDPRIAGFARTETEAGQLASVMRVPYGPYWPPVLRALCQHVDELVNLSRPLEVAAQVCGLWLRTTPREVEPGHPYPGRREAATVAKRLAREVQGRRAEQVLVGDGIDERVYEAVLLGTPDLPDEISELALELVCRRSPATETRARADAHERREVARRQELASNPEFVKRAAEFALLGGIGPGPRGQRRAPWPDGPGARVDAGFRKVCLNNAAAFEALIIARPAAAREVLLAACIEPPEFDDPSDLHTAMMDNLGTEAWREGFPAMYFRGPFLQFLRCHRVDGLEVILRLVNFATERWADSARRYHRHYGGRDAESLPTVNVPMERGSSEWSGDYHVYTWYRLGSLTAPCVTNSLMALEKWLYEQLDDGQDITQWLLTILEQSRSVAFAGVLAALGCKRPALLEGPLRSLLGVWQIYEWEIQRLLSADLWRIEEATWQRQGGQTFWRLAQDWHTLPHRQLNLQDVAVTLLLTKPEMAAYFEHVRGLWRSQCDTELDKGALALLIARLDPANYKQVTADNGRAVFKLEWPEPLRQAIDANAAQREREMRLMCLPVRCRRILDNRTPLPAPELEIFWSELRAIAESRSAGDQEPATRHLADAICGGVAVLVRLHRGWLGADPRRAEWCLEQLLCVLTDPPPVGEFACAESTYPMGWGRFAAEAAVEFLAERPTDRDVRASVGSLVMSFQYEVTAYALQAAFDVRDRLGDDFVRLQNLVILWAGLRSVLIAAGYDGGDLARWERWRERLSEAFRDARIRAVPLSWQRVARIARIAIHRLEKQRFHWADDATEEPDDDDTQVVRTGLRRRKGGRSTRPGLDVQVIQAAFNWIPALDQARDPAERRGWIALVREALGVTLSMLPEDSDPDIEWSRMPYTYDLWVFRQVAVAIPHMTPEERPEELWRPILELGGPAHCWVSDFLSVWFDGGARLAPSLNEFVDRWQDMIQYALASPKWSECSRHLQSHVADLMSELMGLNVLGNSVGEADYAAAITRLRPLFRAFSRRWLCVPQVASDFAAFLTRPAAETLICDGIQWLHAAVSNYDPYDWRDDGLAENLIEALRTCWIKRRHEVQHESEVRKAFQDLLGVLTQRQNPAALELRDEVGRSTTA